MPVNPSLPPDPKLQPPRWARRLLAWVLPEPLFEELAGDLEEQFCQHAAERGLRRARLLYVLEALAFCRPYFLARSRRLNPHDYPNPLFSDMLTNYLTVARRNLLRHKALSAINIGGLAVGMAVAMLIGLWMWDELSFDRYHRNYDRIVRVQRHTTINNETGTGTSLPYPLAHELKAKYGNYFKHVVMAWWVEDHTLSVGDKKVSLTGQFIEAGAPEMLTLDMQQGTWGGLRDPHSVMLSASAARALFGDGDPLGKALKVDNNLDVTVTGVYADLPPNTHFHPIKYFLPWDLLMGAIPAIKEQGWDNNFLSVYAELQPHAGADQVSARIKDLIFNNTRDNKEYFAYHPQVFLHPMRKWHLQSEWEDGVNTGGMVQYVWLFGIIGAFVLLLAAINFMNLSTARSEKRAKEVGVRKTMGSVKSQLVGQFFSESFLVVVLAFGVALLLAAGFLPWFNHVAAKQLQMPWFNPCFWGAGGLFIGLTGLLAGSYPAFYLSSFRPVQVLKGTFRVGRLAALPRKALVVVQFTVSVALITGTLLVYRQIEHAKNRPVGYSREGLVMVRITNGEIFGKFDLLRNELKNSGAVAEAALSAHQATQPWASNGGFDWPGKDPDLQTDFGTLTVSPEYGKTVGWQFVAGRDFSREFASDSAGYVVNEAAVQYMGLKNPVGTTIRYEGRPFRILGVVKDMVMGSPFEPVQPTVFFLKGPLYWMNLRIKPGVAPGRALPKMEAVFKKVLPDVAFDYQFADQEYALKFATEERTRQLAAVFAGLAIIISCLGLFGLASFMAEQRTKEIGIRKVMGASVAGLWRLLSKEFVYLVGLACLIALPLSYYGLSRWLAQYTYRTTLAWWIFAGAGGAALLITLLTVSYQAVKAALANPVKSLRNE